VRPQQHITYNTAAKGGGVYIGTGIFYLNTPTSKDSISGNNARPLEVAAIIEDNIIKVIHAMKLQKKDYHLLEGLHAES
jgi:hypothetical protein